MALWITWTGIKKNKTNRDWHVIAGNISFNIAFPFQNEKEKELLPLEERDYFSDMNLSQAYHSNKRLHIGEHKIKFIKKYINNWYVRCVVYIPRQYLEFIKNHSNSIFENLLRKGWIESFPLREALYQDTTVADVIEEVAKSNSFSHEHRLLLLAYNYFIDASSGRGYVLKPAANDHVISNAIESFENLNGKYFQTKKYFKPLPFIYDKLKAGERDWGILSILHLPIPCNYSIKKLFLFLDDLQNIKVRVDTRMGNSPVAKYKLPDIIGYGNTGGRSKTLVKNINQLRDGYLKTAFKVDPARINLSSKEFSNLILIKSL